MKCDHTAEEGIEEILGRESDFEASEVKALIEDPNNTIYIKVPKHVTKYMDHFGVEYDERAVKGMLGVFSLWLKVVDDVIDNSTAPMDQIVRVAYSPEILDDFEGEVPMHLRLTAVMSRATASQHHYLAKRMEVLQQAVWLERDSRNISQLINRRKNTGRCTSYATLDVMRPYVEARNKEFERFLIDLGAAGILADSMFDLKQDYRNGELRFFPTTTDKMHLYGQVLKECTRMAVKYPFLVREYLRGVTNLPKIMQSTSRVTPSGMSR